LDVFNRRRVEGPPRLAPGESPGLVLIPIAAGFAAGVLAVNLFMAVIKQNSIFRPASFPGWMMHRMW